MAAAVTGMLSWVAGVALIPLDAKLEKGNQQLQTHSAQLYAEALLAVLGAVLLAGFFAVLTRLCPPGHPGWGLLRVSLAGCVITQTMVAAGASFASAGVHAAAGGADVGLAAFGWRGLADVPGLRGADHRVHGDRGAGLAAGRAVATVGVRSGLTGAHHGRRRDWPGGSGRELPGNSSLSRLGIRLCFPASSTGTLPCLTACPGRILHYRPGPIPESEGEIY